jgi:hypothetical protein
MGQVSRSSVRDFVTGHISRPTAPRLSRACRPIPHSPWSLCYVVIHITPDDVMSKPGRVVDHIVRHSVGRTTIRFQSATRTPIPRGLLCHAGRGSRRRGACRRSDAQSGTPVTDSQSGKAMPAVDAHWSRPGPERSRFDSLPRRRERKVVFFHRLRPPGSSEKHVEGLPMYAGFLTALAVACIAFAPVAMAQSKPQPSHSRPAAELKKQNVKVPDRAKRAFPSCEKCRASGCEQGAGACFMTPSGCTCVMRQLPPR